MEFRPIIATGIIAVGLLAPAVAEAAYVTSSVNLRTGPGTNYARITTIPAGAQIRSLGCGGWCKVDFHGTRGFILASYVAGGNFASPPPMMHRPPPPKFGFVKKPWWDTKRNAWYDGKRWYVNGHWYLKFPG